MAGGAWFDITDAGSIQDITTKGDIVSDETINALYVTHHTKSDGMTYDLRTNQQICIFDIYDTYDLEQMEELEVLKLQYDMMKESGDDSDTAKRNLKLVQEFFATNVKTEETDSYDIQIAAVQKYYEQLVSNDADMTETEVVVNVMGKLDSARKAVVYQIVDNELTILQDKVADGTSDDKDIEYYELDDNLLTAIGNCQSEVSNALIEAQGNMLAEGNVILSQKEYELDQALIGDALSTDYSSCDVSVAGLIDLSNISKELIVSKSSELTMLDELIEKADAKYIQALSAGVSERYKAEQNKNSSHAVLDSVKKEDIASVNAIRSEMQFLVKAKTERQDSSMAESFVVKRISGASDFMTAVKTDDYQDSMQNTVKVYKGWLEELLADIRGQSASDENSLYEQKEVLQEEWLAALDEEDLDQAKLLEAKIAVIDGQIAQQEQAAADELQTLQQQKLELESQIEKNPSDSSLQSMLSKIEADIADVTTKLSDDGQAATIMDMKKDTLSLLEKEDTSSHVIEAIQTNLEGIGSMLDGGSPLALTALKEIYKEMVASAYLNDITAYDPLILKIEEMVAEAEVLEIEQKGVTGEVALSAIEEVLGGSISVSSLNKDSDSNNKEDTTIVNTEGLTDEEVIAALVALGDYAQKSDSDEVETLAAAMAISLAEEGDIPVFMTHRDEGETYAPADLLADFTGYRYVWNSTKKSVVLSSGRHYFTFTAFSSKVIKENNQEEWMDTGTMFSGTVYLPGSYISSNFDCEVYDISGTGYSVLVNDKVTEVSQEIQKAISEKGGN